jgi:hypothetical protein
MDNNLKKMVLMVTISIFIVSNLSLTVSFAAVNSGYNVTMSPTPTNPSSPSESPYSPSSPTNPAYPTSPAAPTTTPTTPVTPANSIVQTPNNLLVIATLQIYTDLLNRLKFIQNAPAISKIYVEVVPGGFEQKYVQIFVEVVPGGFQPQYIPASKEDITNLEKEVKIYETILNSLVPSIP